MYYFITVMGVGVLNCPGSYILKVVYIYIGGEIRSDMFLTRFDLKRFLNRHICK